MARWLVGVEVRSGVWVRWVAALVLRGDAHVRAHALVVVVVVAVVPAPGRASGEARRLALCL